MAEVTLKHTVQRMRKVSGKISRLHASMETWQEMKESQLRSGFNLETIDNSINCYIESIDTQANVLADLCDNLKGKL